MYAARSITLSAVLALAAGAGAQQQTFVVTLDAGVLPERPALLDALRKHVGSGPAVWAGIVADLRAKDQTASAGVRAAVAALGGTVADEYWALGGLAVQILPSAAAQLAAHPEVVAVAPDSLLGATIFAQTSAANHGADAVQALGLTGAGATLALVDSGIDVAIGVGGPPHPAFVDGNGASRIVAAVGVANPLDFEDTTGHGTAVAGIAAARDWSALATTDHGFAPDARIASYKITHDALGNFWSSTWLAAWHRVLEDREQHGIVAAVASYSGNPSPTHLTQRITDVVAYYGDVLIATSAGNDGNLPDPAARSQANTNGLAVAAVAANQHAVLGFSSPGPLPGDPLRTWPDLCAVGSPVFAPAPDNATGTSLPLSGTSYAAPAVAGTALVVRAVRPDLTATATKALILNACADTSPQNPWLGRNFHGLGLLRTDLAVEHAQSGTLRSGVAGTVGTISRLTLPLQTGTRYAATVAWPRVDVTHTDWNDLDLRVRDAGGLVVAESASPRNCYERVLFTATATGPFTLEVVTNAATDPEAPWSLVLAPHSVGGPQAGTIVLDGASCPGRGVDLAAAPVVPIATAGAPGITRTTTPFADVPTRTQQAFDGATIPAGLVVEALAFRRDEAQPDAPGYDVDVEILLGHTLAAPASLSPTFAANWDGAPVQVLRATAARMPAASGVSAGPGQFDYVIPLTQPFTTGTSATRHLLVEISVFGHTRGSAPFGLWLDADADLTKYARVRTQGLPFAANGQIDALAPAMALVPAGTTSVLPRLDAAGPLALGTVHEVALRGAPPLAPAALGWGPAPVSVVDLTAIGAPGCALGTSADTVLPVAVDPTGQGVLRLGVGVNAGLTGLEFVEQFVVLDPAANALGITTTNRAVGRIGG